MTEKHICIMAIALLAIVSSIALLDIQDGISKDTDASDSTMTVPNNSLNIIVIGTGESADAITSNLGTMGNVIQAQSIEQHLSKNTSITNAFIFTDSWIVSNAAEAPRIVSHVVNEGSIASLYKQQIDWKSTGLSVSYGDDDTMTSVCVTNGVTRCYSVTCDDENEALSKTVQWMNDVTSVNGNKQGSVDDQPLGSEIESYVDYESSGYGWTAVRTHYYKLDDVSQTYDYYAAHYTVTLEPNSGSFNSGIDVSSSMDNGYLLKHGPSTTPSDTTVTVNIGYSASSEGLSFNTGSSWTYTIRDITISNHSSVVNNKMDIRHNISENSSTGSTTCTVEPGKLVKIDSTNSYISSDTYKTQFCHRYLGQYGAFNDVTKTVNVIIEQ